VRAGPALLFACDSISHAASLQASTAIPVGASNASSTPACTCEIIEEILPFAGRVVG